MDVRTVRVVSVTAQRPLVGVEPPLFDALRPRLGSAIALIAQIFVLHLDLVDVVDRHS